MTSFTRFTFLLSRRNQILFILRRKSMITLGDAPGKRCDMNCTPSLAASAGTQYSASSCDNGKGLRENEKREGDSGCLTYR